MSLSHRFSQIAFLFALGLAAQAASAGAASPDASPPAQRPAVAPAQRPAVGPAHRPGPAQDAATSANMEVILLHGTNDGSGIDPRIGKIPELSKPPFSSYNSYKLLDRPKVTVQKGKESKIKLPNDREMAIALKDIIAPKKKGEVTRYLVSTSIQKPGGNTFLPLLEVNAKAGEWFFVAGQTYKGGTLVIGIKVLP